MEAIIKLLHGTSYPTLFFIGLVTRLLIGMRQFSRRGVGGLQHFNNYFTGLITLFFEWVLKWAATIMMVRGLTGWLLK
ncbi:hypothetical protein [Parafilimonas sp.]|uniref:hypothetical protein n=1 Tax=Parafilimonas sp. TaxID=1969739 RepID=UPI0039E5BABE